MLAKSQRVGYVLSSHVVSLTMLTSYLFLSSVTSSPPLQAVGGNGFLNALFLNTWLSLSGPLAYWLLCD